MPISIDINDKHIKPLIDFYIEKQREIKAQISALEAESKELAGVVMQLRNASRRPTMGGSSDMAIDQINDSELYNSSWTWVNKIEFAIRNAGKPLTSREIATSLSEIDHSFVGDDGLKKAVSSISAVLAVNAGDYFEKKKFIKRKNNSGDFEFQIWSEDLKPVSVFSNAIKDLWGTSINASQNNSDLPF